MSKPFKKNKRAVIAFKNMDKFHNQFKELPPSYSHRGVHFMIHNDPQFLHTGDEVVTNYDLCFSSLIKGCGGDKDQHDPKTIVLEREDKLRVSNRLRKASKVVNTSLMILPDVYGPFKLGDYTFHMDFPERKYLTKPIYGARSLGIYLIDATTIGLKNLLIPLAEYLEDFTDVCEFPDKLKPYVKIISRDEVEKNEFEKTMKDDDGFIIEEYIDNVVAEYRIIAYRGEIRFIGKRQRNVQGKAHDADLLVQEHTYGPQAWHQDIPKDFYPEVSTIDEIFDEFKNILDHLPQEPISIDFYITADGRWGIFEYCTQFGTRFVPAVFLQEVYRDFIYDQCNK